MAIQLNILQLKQPVVELFFILKTRWIILSEVILRSRKKELDSIFIVVINSKGKNLIIGYIYQFRSINPSEFTGIYISKLLGKISKEDKTIVLMGHFNIDLLKYDTNTDSTTCLDSMYTNSLLPYISTPTRITAHSKTLINNIFSNNIEDGLISGNITTTITDPYAQFLLKKDKTTTTIKNYFDTILKSSMILSLISNWKNTEWNTHVEAVKKDINISFDQFLLKFNNLSQQDAPLKQLSNKDIKRMKKPSITKGI